MQCKIARDGLGRILDPRNRQAPAVQEGLCSAGEIAAAQELTPVEAQAQEIISEIWKIYVLNRPPRTLPKRGDDKKLAGLVLASVIQTAVGVDIDVATARIRSAGVNVERHQIDAFFEGRHTPRLSLVAKVANALQIPELLRLFHFPWSLLRAAKLTTSEIRAVCERSQQPPNFELYSGVPKGQVPLLHRPHQFFPQWCDFRLRPPTDPQIFWQHIAGFRAAEALRDANSMNFHRWQAVTYITSLAAIPAVRANFDLLCRCMRDLSRRSGWRDIWFTVNWEVVRQAIETEDYVSQTPFSDVFSGAKGDIFVEPLSTNLSRRLAVAR